MDLRKLPAVEPLIKGMLYRDTLAQLAGTSGCYKDVRRRRVQSRAGRRRVLRVRLGAQAGEGRLRRRRGGQRHGGRVFAWCEVWGIDRPPRCGEVDRSPVVRRRVHPRRDRGVFLRPPVERGLHPCRPTGPCPSCDGHRRASVRRPRRGSGPARPGRVFRPRLDRRTSSNSSVADPTAA
jgi:hypothetical protein